MHLCAGGFTACPIGCRAGTRTLTNRTKVCCATITPHGNINAPFIAVFDSVERFRDSTDLFPLFIPFGTNLQLGRGFVPATGLAPESAYLKEYAVLLELRGLIPAYLHRRTGSMGINCLLLDCYVRPRSHRSDALRLAGATDFSAIFTNFVVLNKK